MKKDVIVLLYPGCISFEVALAAELLSAQYRILNASPDGSDLEVATGLPLRTQLGYPQVTLENCVSILVPGGNPDSIVENREIDRIINEADRRGILIGAICAGPSMLAKAGILKGKRIAHGYGPKQLDFLKDIFMGVQLTDEPFVADGHILTAKPKAFAQFANEIATRLLEERE